MILLMLVGGLDRVITGGLNEGRLGFSSELIFMGFHVCCTDMFKVRSE